MDCLAEASVISVPLMPNAMNLFVPELCRPARSTTTNKRAAFENEDEEGDEEEEEEENEETKQARGGGTIILVCNFEGCKKEFISKWSLTRHIRTHTGERPFQCEKCGKEFVQKCSLKRHEQTHSQEKTWICDFSGCGKRFKLRDYLEVHRKSHTHTYTHTYTHTVKIDESLPINKNETTAAQFDHGSMQTQEDTPDEVNIILIEQLRERIVRLSVRHHEQISQYQERDRALLEDLAECSLALGQTLTIIEDKGEGDSVPAYLYGIYKKHVKNDEDGSDGENCRADQS